MGDRGSTLPELLIAMGLTVTALTAVMVIMSASSRTVERLSSDDPLAAVAVDWLADDLREATALDVVASDGADQVTELDIDTPDGTVRWGSASGVIERTAPGERSAQPVAEGLRTADAILISLRNAKDEVVDPSDGSAVDACTRFVRIEVFDADAVTLHARTVSVRYPRWETPTC